MFLLNNIKIRDINEARTLGDTQYPRGWFLNAENREAVGITEVPDPVWPDPKLYNASENPDGTLIITPIDPEVIAAQAAYEDKARVSRLWQAAHDYELQYISGSAIGLITLGVVRSLPKCLAVQAWIKSIWAAYYTSKADRTESFDFYTLGPCPHTVPELMEELGV